MGVAAMTPHVHDLVQIGDLGAVREVNQDAPPWVWRSLRATPWVVVRRPHACHGLIPAGVRGDERAQRHPIDVPLTAVTQVVAPHHLTARLLDGAPTGAITGTVAALRAWFSALDTAGLVWGPVGAVGFELATGRRVTTVASDLDIVVTMTTWPGPHALWRLPRTPTRLDCLLETPTGAVAWAEAASDARDVLWRTPGGPRLARNPRRAAA